MTGVVAGADLEGGAGVAAAAGVGLAASAMRARLSVLLVCGVADSALCILLSNAISWAVDA